MNHSESSGDALMPKPRLARELGVSSRTLSRWMGDEGLEFPQPLRIRGRLFFTRSAVEAWKASRLRASASEHGAA